MVEEFRVPIVDSALFRLFLEKKLGKKSDFEEVNKTQYQLSAEGKAKVVEAVYERLHRTVKWRRKQRTLQAIIGEQVRSLARHFQNSDEVYTPFDFSLVL
jgi:CRISPR/Cas system-associated endonuclease Cas1